MSFGFKSRKSFWGVASSCGVLLLLVTGLAHIPTCRRIDKEKWRYWDLHGRRSQVERNREGAVRERKQAEIDEKIEREWRIEEDLREQYRDLLFSRDGLADRNKNGCIEFNELADAYRRAGYEGEIIHGVTKLPNLSSSYLKRVVESYRAEEGD